ncbi:hypothetical protein ACLOJK_034340, partial [Asimina triloba]
DAISIVKDNSTSCCSKLNKVGTGSNCNCPKLQTPNNHHIPHITAVNHVLHSSLQHMSKQAIAAASSKGPQVSN